MSNPRSEARAALVEAEKAVHEIPLALTLCSIAKVVAALLAVLRAVRKTAEWMDACEMG